MANHGTKIDHIPPQSQIAKMPTQNLIKLIELIFFLLTQCQQEKSGSNIQN